MDRRCIALYDSGAGGLTLLKVLKKKYPKENFAYFSDRKNFPYGNKSAKEIAALAREKTENILSFCPKAIIFACNTLSTVALEKYTNFPVKVFGVLPKIYPGERTLIISTPSTAQSDYVKNLTSQSNTDVLPAFGLADEIESWLGGGGKPDISVGFNGCKTNYDAVVLGCTHYSYLKSDFEKFFSSSVIRDGFTETCDKIQGWLPTNSNDSGTGEMFFNDEKDEYIFREFLKGF